MVQLLTGSLTAKFNMKGSKRGFATLQRNKVGKLQNVLYKYYVLLIF